MIAIVLDISEFETYCLLCLLQVVLVAAGLKLDKSKNMNHHNLFNSLFNAKTIVTECFISNSHVLPLLLFETWQKN